MDGTAANNGINGTPVQCMVREQDRFMPIANVIRIMRRVLPGHAKISDDAKETIQECVSEYISFITSEANERCQREQRKTITAEDVIWAMSKLGFDDYIDPLTMFLQRYREMEGDQRGSIRGEPLPLRRTASGGGSALLPLQPATQQQPMSMANPAAVTAMESGMFVPSMQQVFHVPLTAGMNAGQHQQQVGVYGEMMSGYYYGAYGDGGGGSNSGSFDSYAPYR